MHDDITDAFEKRLALHRDEMIQAVAKEIQSYTTKAALEKRLGEHTDTLLKAVVGELKEFRAENAKHIAAEILPLVREVVRQQLPAEFIEVASKAMHAHVEQATKANADALERQEKMLKAVIDEVRKSQTPRITVQPPLVRRVIERDADNNIIGINEVPVG